jgi:hypothetical protein
MYFDMAWVPRSNYGLSGVTFSSLDTSTLDYYLILGEAAPESGIFRNEFYAIDPDYITVTIDGVEAVNMGADDNLSVLGANEYSIYPTAGVIRFSAADVGKSVTATYTTITHD